MFNGPLVCRINNSRNFVLPTILRKPNTEVMCINSAFSLKLRSLPGGERGVNMVKVWVERRTTVVAVFPWKHEYEADAKFLVPD